MKKIITISREFGAGAGEIGRAVAKKLGYEYYDKAIILKSSQNSNIDVNSFYKWDEKVPTNFSFAQSLFDFYNKPLNEKLFEAQKETIREIGEKGNCVIVGRNANMILKEFDYALHVFIHANPKFRAQRLQTFMPKDTMEKIQEEIKRIDKARKKHCMYYTGTEFGAPAYYDISFNTATIGIDSCIDMICELVNKKS